MGSLYRPVFTNRKGRRIQTAVWWIKYYRNGRPTRESSGTKRESEAKRLLKLREGDIARGVPVVPKIGRVKFEELAQDVVNDYQINGKRSIGELRRRLQKHILPFFGNRRAASITTADARTFASVRQAAGASNGEINRELAVIKRALSLGLQAGKLMFKPYVPMLAENNIRTGFFEPAEFQAVRRQLPVFLQPLVDFFYITGWRKNEVLSLQWRQVDFSAGRVTLDPGTTKNKAGRVFPFTQEMAALLQQQRAQTSVLERKLGIVVPWVFHRRGRRIRSFRGAWEKACKAAALPGRLAHDFRRTAVRNLVRAGIPERVAMQMTGHKTRAVFERYNIVSEGDLTDAARRLDELTDKAAIANASGGRVTLLDKPQVPPV